MIRDANSDDAVAVAEIYNHYIANTVVTFEEVPVTSAEMESRIAKATTWLVLEDQTGIAGYAYAGPWHVRCAYRHTVETSVYLNQSATGRGFGKQLYAELLKRLGDLGLHVAIGGIALPNPASVALHESLGFDKAAHYKEVGRKLGKWIDVGYWQRILSPDEPPIG